MPRLSIVIPCLGGAAEFDGTLVSVLQHRPANCEVLVVHSEPYDDPYELRGEVVFLHREGRSLVELVNAALEETTGEIIHVLGCGLEATENWTAPAIAHFADPEVAAVAPIVLAADRERLIAAGVRWTLGGARRAVNDRRILTPGSGRLRAQVIAPMLTAGFYRREVLAALDGFEEAMGDLLADVAYGLSLQTLERLTVVEPAAQVICRAEPVTASCSSLTLGKVREQLFWRAAAERGLARSLALHAALVSGEALSRSGLIGLLGRGLGLLTFGASSQYRAVLESARSRLAELAELRAKRRRLIEPAVRSRESSIRKAA